MSDGHRIRANGKILAIWAFLLPTSCTGLVMGGPLAGGGVAGYYAHEKGWLKMEKKEVEEKTKEDRAELSSSKGNKEFQICTAGRPGCLLE